MQATLKSSSRQISALCNYKGGQNLKNTFCVKKAHTEIHDGWKFWKGRTESTKFSVLSMSNSSFSPLWATKSEKKKHTLVIVALPHNTNTIISASREKWHSQKQRICIEYSLHIKLGCMCQDPQHTRSLTSFTKPEVVYFSPVLPQTSSTTCKNWFLRKCLQNCKLFCLSTAFKQNRTDSGNDNLLKYYWRFFPPICTSSGVN